MNLGRLPTGPLDSLLARRSNPYTIYEETGGNQDWNGKNGLTSTSTSVNIDVHGHSTSPQSYPTGETYSTSLQGLLSVDEKVPEITEGNCIVHGGQVFEMTVDPWPDSNSPNVYVLELEERTDLQDPT